MMASPINKKTHIVHRQDFESVESQEKADGAHHAGKYGARIRKLEEQPVHPQKHQDIGDVGVAQKG